MNDYSSAIQVSELFVGRRLVAALDKDIRLVVIPEVTEIHVDEPDDWIIKSEQAYEIFVDGKLYAKVKENPKRPRLHAPIELWKDRSDGKMRLRLVKKYTELIAKID